MFKKGKLLRGAKTGTLVEVVSWPLVRVVYSRRGRRYVGLEFHASDNFTLIGNNYKAKE